MKSRRLEFIYIQYAQLNFTSGFLKRAMWVLCLNFSHVDFMSQDMIIGLGASPTACWEGVASHQAKPKGTLSVWVWVRDKTAICDELMEGQLVLRRWSSHFFLLFV